MPRKIVVSSNCQTGGVAAALAAMLPDDHIIPFPLPAASDDAGSEELVATLKHADAWASSGRYNLLDSGDVQQLKVTERLVKFPEIWFSAFHPDIVYAQKISTGAFTAPHYNSAIALWAYRHKLETKDAARLFNAESFAALGYFDRWDSSVKQLEQRFKSTDLDFWQFFLSVKRGGLFMHSVNHPMPAVLTRLAAQVSLRLGADAAVFSRTISVNDSLLATIWPVYPPIGDQLAISGCYDWKIQGAYYCGTRAYVDFVYASYASQQISADDIVAIDIDEAAYDRVLGAQATVRT